MRLHEDDGHVYVMLHLTCQAMPEKEKDQPLGSGNSPGLKIWGMLSIDISYGSWMDGYMDGSYLGDAIYI